MFSHALYVHTHNRRDCHYSPPYLEISMKQQALQPVWFGWRFHHHFIIIFGHEELWDYLVLLLVSSCSRVSSAGKGAAARFSTEPQLAAELGPTASTFSSHSSLLPSHSPLVDRYRSLPGRLACRASRLRSLFIVKWEQFVYKPGTSLVTRACSSPRHIKHTWCGPLLKN